MKSLCIVLVAALLDLCAIGQQPVRPPAHDINDLQAIEALEQADAAAAKANDVDLLTSLWTEDGVLLQPMSAPVIGRTNIHELLEAQRQRSANLRMLSYQEDWKERQVHDGRAFEWGTITATMQLPNGKQATQTVYAARVLVRANDKSWRFARAIISPAAPPAVTTAGEDKQ
jgi:uncharacterized protein (TIGR02246 family)